MMGQRKFDRLQTDCGMLNELCADRHAVPQSSVQRPFRPQRGEVLSFRSAQAWAVMIDVFAPDQVLMR